MAEYKSILRRAVLALGLVLSFAAAALEAPLTLSPDDGHPKLSRLVADLLTRYHYRQVRLDDDMSQRILDDYLRALDFSRMYFLAEDVQEFKRFGDLLDDRLLSGDLSPAYLMYNRLQRRIAERTESIHALLARPVDFSIDETLDLDRKDAAWATSEAELEELWRLRLKHELLSLVLAGKDLDEARKTLVRRYDTRLRRARQTTSEDAFQTYLNAVAQTFDPHSTYFSPRTSENFNIQMRLSLEGIGAVLRMEEDVTTVVELVAGGPADKSKEIHPKDRIIAVGQGDDGELVDVVGWRLDDVVELIRGKRDSVVRLQVVPASDPPESVGKVVRLVRNRIELEEQAAKSELRELEGDGQGARIGVITIPTFYADFAAAQRGDRDYRSTTRDVSRLLAELADENIDGLVIDLRRNGGGSLQEAVDLTGLFLRTGPVVQVRDARGSLTVEEDTDPGVAYAGPLVVLVDRHSASASEIFAAAIQDYGRGVVVGEQTFGKGTVQSLVDLNRFLPEAGGKLGQLKLTVAKFYRISGSSTQHRGVLPDIQFPTAVVADEFGESAQLHALPWDEISPVRHDPPSQRDRLLAELERRHILRVGASEEFTRLARELLAQREAGKRTVVSLQESVRRADLAAGKGLPDDRGEAESDAGDEDQANDQGPDPLLDEAVAIAGDISRINGGPITNIATATP